VIQTLSPDGARVLAEKVVKSSVAAVFSVAISPDERRLAVAYHGAAEGFDLINPSSLALECASPTTGGCVFGHGSVHFAGSRLFTSTGKPWIDELRPSGENAPTRLRARGQPHTRVRWSRARRTVPLPHRHVRIRRRPLAFEPQERKARRPGPPWPRAPVRQPDARRGPATRARFEPRSCATTERNRPHPHREPAHWPSAEVDSNLGVDHRHRNRLLARTSLDTNVYRPRRCSSSAPWQTAGSRTRT